MAAGFELMEWTFDPLQALNAHLNFYRLGVTCDEYARNLYGESSSALHRGTPTDRFVVQWRLRDQHVQRRIERADSALHVRALEAARAPTVNETFEAGRWRRSRAGDLAIEAPRMWVEIPLEFTDMLQSAPD